MLSIFLLFDRSPAPKGSACRRCFSLRPFSAVFAIAVLTAAFPGCGGAGGGAPEAERSHLYRLGAAYKMYIQSHQQQPPADAKTFQDFVAGLSERQRGLLQAEEIDVFFKSPRDGEPYVILYGDQARKNTHGVVAYEQQPGADGKRWLATNLGDVSAVDETEFRKLTSKK